MRKKIFEIIEVSDGSNRASAVYDYMMMAVILLSLLPLTVKSSEPVLQALDYVTAGIFILDYLLRICTADYKLQKGAGSFILYPFTPMAIIDLLCILPTFTAMSNGLKVLKVLRLFRTFRVFRALKMVRYSKSIRIITAVMRKQRVPLLAVCTLAIAYTLICALVIFNVEPDTFENFFEAVYWATVSLTTMGYGDIYPVTNVGRIVTMLSSVVGIAIVALPSGIITAGYMDEIQQSRNEQTRAD